MLKKSIWFNLVVALPLTFLFGCMDFGKVDQGRAVSFDKDKRTVTIIRDKKIDTQNPDYSYLPPLTYVLPTDPIETGPEPKAGGRIKLSAAWLIERAGFRRGEGPGPVTLSTRHSLAIVCREGAHAGDAPREREEQEAPQAGDERQPDG